MSLTTIRCLTPGPLHPQIYTTCQLSTRLPNKSLPLVIHFYLYILFSIFIFLLENISFIVKISLHTQPHTYKFTVFLHLIIIFVCPFYKTSALNFVCLNFFFSFLFCLLLWVDNNFWIVPFRCANAARSDTQTHNTTETNRRPTRKAERKQ